MTATGEWVPFQLVPDDVLFFRDGKPSTRGSDHYLRSLFPPHPSTLYGALRTRRLFDEGIELSGIGAQTWDSRLGNLRDELGSWGSFGSMTMRGPWLVRDGEPLLPAPADLGVVAVPSRTGGRIVPAVEKAGRFRPADTGEGGWSHPLALLRAYEHDNTEWRDWRGKEPAGAAGWYLTPRGFTAWRLGGVPAPDDFVHPLELWEDEARTGVGLDNEEGRRFANEGQLYTFGFVRLRSGVGIGFEVKDSALEAEGRVRLGGESRTVALQPGPSFPAPLPPESAAGSARFSLCFLTPSLSTSGAWPPGFSPNRPEGVLAGCRCRLIAAAVPGFTAFGGWDMVRKYPKPLRRALPSGTVFLFENLDGESVPKIDGTCLSDISEEGMARQGFGLAATGLSR